MMCHVAADQQNFIKFNWFLGQQSPSESKIIQNIRNNISMLTIDELN